MVIDRVVLLCQHRFRDRGVFDDAIVVAESIGDRELYVWVFECLGAPAISAFLFLSLLVLLYFVYTFVNWHHCTQLILTVVRQLGLERNL